MTLRDVSSRFSNKESGVESIDHFILLAFAEQLNTHVLNLLLAKVTPAVCLSIARGESSYPYQGDSRSQ